MFNRLLEASIRIVFSSLMSVPLILFCYFMLHFSDNTDCYSDYLKHIPTAAVTPPIAWPDNGLLTIGFEHHFFVNHKKMIMQLMQSYHFSGVLALSHHQSCRAQALSIAELLQLQKQGWEITSMDKKPRFDDKDSINDMPSPDKTKQKIYDLSLHAHPLDYQQAFMQHLEATKIRNGWMMLYLHAQHHTRITKSITIAQLEPLLKMIKYSHIPVVLQAQVLKISQ